MAAGDSTRRTAGRVDSQPPERIMTLRTATGSTYEIDCTALTWRRVPTLGSGVLRSESGPLVAVRPVEIGSPALLVCPPFRPGGPTRAIVTSPVVAIDGCAASRCVAQPPDCPWSSRLGRPALDA